MSERPSAPPGTLLVAALIAAGLLAAAWLRAGRVLVGSGGAVPDMRLDLNSASAAELVVLPGLGEKLAERVVVDREARGPFRSVAELERVPGVSAALAERLAPYLAAGPE
jgi:competence protein ComEA